MKRDEIEKLLDDAANMYGDMRGVRKLRDAAPDLACLCLSLMDSLADRDRLAAELAEAKAQVAALREALKVEHAYWDAKAANDLRLQDAGEAAMDYPMPRRMTEAMRKADALAAALAAAEEAKG